MVLVRLNGYPHPRKRRGSGLHLPGTSTASRGAGDRFKDPVCPVGVHCPVL